MNRFWTFLTSTPARRTRFGRRPRALRLCVETLEDRRLLAFLEPVDYSVGAWPQAVVAGEFNNDGQLDLVTANVGDNTVSVLLGNSAGTFQQPAQNFDTGAYPISVAVGDFDGDGNLDIATANDDDSIAPDTDISILLGNGNATFAPAVHLSIDSNLWARSIPTGDLNADGKSDLVLTSDDPGGFTSGNNGSVRILISQGDGIFTPTATQYFSSDDSLLLSAPVLTDFNRDGKVDVAVAQSAAGSPTGSIKILLGRGDGTLNTPLSATTYSGAETPAVGDFTSDGILDLVTTGGGSGSVDVRPGRGDGTFSARISSAAFLGDSITAADLNGDGHLDVVTSYWSSENLSVLLGRGNGTFIQSDEPWSGLTVGRVAVADFNGDGSPDLATASGGADVVSVLLNDGNWPVLPPVPPTVGISNATVTEGNTGAANASFTVMLSAVSSQNVSVAYATGNGTATSGSDYQATSGTLTIPAGHTTGTITVLVSGDRLAEPNETFFISLSNPTNAIIVDDQAVGTIMDDEPRISISDFTKAEDKKGKTTLFIFTVTLSAACDQAVTMSYRTVNGTATTGNSDYIAKTGTLSFAPGETTKTITIEVKGDSKKEANESFYLDLYGLSSNALFTKNRGIGTILNDD